MQVHNSIILMLTDNRLSSEWPHIILRYHIQRDCRELLEGGCHTSGVYTIQPDDMDPFEVGSKILLVIAILSTQVINGHWYWCSSN